MDQLGFMVKKIEDNGYIRVERVGGVPEKALLSQDVVIVNNKEELIQGVIGNKAHHATQPNEKYTVHKVNEIYIDAGLLRLVFPSTALWEMLLIKLKTLHIS